MKLITLGIGLISISLSAVIRYEQASRLVPRIAPHASEYQGPTKMLTVRDNKGVKNFTHNELFSLQKRFLDNFVAPKNAYQVRCTASDLLSTITD